MATRKPTKKPRILTDKKGFVFADIIGAIQRAVSWLLSTAPKPLLYLIFLLFLVLFSSVFGFILNSTGQFCDAEGNRYTTGTFSLITNLELLTDMPSNADLGKTTRPADETILAILPKCSKTYTDPYYYSSGTKTNLPTGTARYYDGSFCTDCQAQEIFSNITGDSAKVCTSDVHRLPNEEKNFIQKIFCGGSACEPPVGYYYNLTQGVYVCNDASCTGKTIGDIWRDTLNDKGAKLTTTTIDRKNYQNAISISCEPGDVSPQFRTFGIKIFDYKLWIALFLISIVIWAVFKFKTR